MSTNWGNKLKQLALTAALALMLFGPIDASHMSDTAPVSPASIKLPIKLPPGTVEPQVNWNS